ncbi:MAG TPA: pyrroloquinoline quinone biosynthesis protein PqqB [Myxococcota bacterium]|nr:pyrroloquinoline quinone biosynthesis protein PqqB [Myxococcota bacterium]
MRIRVLGSAAGGGFPQWNCNCQNCRSVRQGAPHTRARTQASLGLSSGDGAWIVINASPDIRAQIGACAGLQPAHGLRDTPIRAVVLTNADIDHVVGLLSLREFQPLVVYCTDQVREWVFEQNVIYRALKTVPGQLSFRRLETSGTHVFEGTGGYEGPLAYEAYAVPSKAPGYLGRISTAGTATIGLRLIDTRTGASVAYVPGVKAVDPALFAFLRRCDAAFVDGTFFTDDELVHMGHAEKTSLALGHIPMTGPEGSLERLADLGPVRKIYIHINNTNPVLREDSPEAAQVRAAGWEIAHDGLELHV